MFLFSRSFEINTGIIVFCWDRGRWTYIWRRLGWMVEVYLEKIRAVGVYLEKIGAAGVYLEKVGAAGGEGEEWEDIFLFFRGRYVVYRTYYFRGRNRGVGVLCSLFKVSRV